MIPLSYQLRSFSSYYNNNKSSSSLLQEAIQSYCVDIFQNIHSKGLSFSYCGNSSSSEEKEFPFYNIYSVKTFLNPSNDSSFFPVQILKPKKTPPEVFDNNVHYGILSDSWVVAMNIVESILSSDEFDQILNEMDNIPLFVNFYMKLILKKKLIDMKSLLIINKLLRRDIEQRFTVQNILQSFFDYTVIKPNDVLHLSSFPPLDTKKYPTIEQKVSSFFDVDGFVNAIIAEEEKNSLLEIFIKENCVVPFLASIPDEAMFECIFSTEKLFFVKFFVFLKTCVIYFKIMIGQLHPIKNKKKIQESYRIETGVGFIEREECCSPFDLYRDVGVTLFGLIEKKRVRDRE